MRIRKRLEGSESARRMVSRNVITYYQDSVLEIVRKLMDGEIHRADFDYEIERLRIIEAKWLLILDGGERDEHETAAVG